MSVGEFLVRAVACVKVADRSSAAPNVTLDGANSPVVDLLDNGLMVVYLVDEGDRFVYVLHRHLQALGADPRGLMEFGLVNLTNLARRKLQVVQQGSFYGLLLDGHFEASLMLVDELWDSALASMTPNGPVIAIPARDILIFCDARDATGIQQMREATARVLQANDHTLTDQLYRRVDGAWVPFGT